MEYVSMGGWGVGGEKEYNWEWKRSAVTKSEDMSLADVRKVKDSGALPQEWLWLDVVV